MVSATGAYQKPKAEFAWRWFLCVATVTVMVRLVVMLVLQSWEFKDQWAFGHEMGRIGGWLAQGNGFTQDGSTPTAKFPPLYPLVVAGFFSLFGIYSKASAAGLFLFQSICASVVAILLVELGRRLWSPTIGLIAGWVWAFYPTSIFYSVIRVWYCEFTLMLLLLTVLIAITAEPPPTFRRTASFGALSGVIILTDPTMAIYLGSLLLWMLWKQKGSLPRLVGLPFAGAVVVALVVSPWVIRNWIVLGSPQLVKANFGNELFIGNVGDGVRYNVKASAAFATLDPDELKHYQNQPEPVYDAYLRNKAIVWILNNPLQFAIKTATRVSQFWLINPALGKDSWSRAMYFGPLLLLGIYGLCAGIRRRWSVAPIVLFLLIFPLPYYVTHVLHGRYIYPIEPFVVLLAAIPLAKWFEPIRVLDVFRPYASDVADLRTQGRSTSAS